jgi:G3E family GTPase
LRCSKKKKKGPPRALHLVIFTADARAVVEDRARWLVRRAVGLAAGVSSLAACGAVAFPRSRPADSSAMPLTGITVVTGFLGAGKTTLVNHVLSADHGYRVAVILNEFGADIGVEKMLVTDNPNGETVVDEDWVEMNNGCVCCTVKGSLIQTIDSLLEKRLASGSRFDFILLETTGLADPGPVAQELWVDDELLEEDSAVLDAVVTLVDASNVVSQLRETREASLQIAFADTLVLNKTDLVSSAELEAIEETLRVINAEARIVRAERSAVDLSLVLNQGAVTVAGRRGRKPTLGEWAKNVPPAVATRGAGFWARGVERYAPTDGKLSPVHDASIRTVCLAAEGIVNRRAFEAWLEDALWERGAQNADADDDDSKLDILRAKGVLFVETSDETSDVSLRSANDAPLAHKKLVLQAVREVYEITPGPPAETGERRMNKVVLIGRGLSEAALLPGFEACVARERG